MKALVLAAGKGSRLGHASGGLPKPLTRVGDTTALQHTLAQVAATRAVDHIWINVHEQPNAIRERIGNDVDGIPVSYSFEEELLGTGGAWKNLAPEWEGTTLLLYGDNFMKLDLLALLATHAGAGTLATIAVFDPGRHANTGIAGGRVELDGNVVRAFVEGGDGSGLVNAGAYCLESAVLDLMPHGFSDFGRHVLPGLAQKRQITAHVMEENAYCLGVDTPEGLEIARDMFNSGKLRVMQ